MFNKKIFILSLFFLTACLQEAANINYKEEQTKALQNNNKKILQPSYMKGTYVKTENNKIVRDLKKENSLNTLENYEDDIEEEKEKIKKEKSKLSSKQYNIKTIIVEPGNSLLGIAQKYSMSLGEISDLNDIRPPYNVYIGQKIKIYDKNYSAVKNTEKVKYKLITVESGDSLLKIAANNSSTLRELAEFNGIKPPYNVYIGQKIKIPINSDVINNDRNYYIVKKGDNLYSIAKKTNKKFSDLIKNNELEKPYNIYVGQKLYFEKQNIPNKSKQIAQNDKKITTKNNNISSSNEVKNNIQNLNNIQATASAMFLWPVNGEVIKKFGKQVNGEFSDAINIKAKQSTNILATNSGEVAYAGNELKGYGNMIIIKHNNGWLSIYGHCDTINVKVKDRVVKGQVIATVGKTGNVDEPQLYFAIRKGRVAMDPLKYLSSNN